MTTRFLAFVVLLSVAELTASWWIWGRAPTDSIRVWYPSFWAFETGRLNCWSIVFASAMALWLIFPYLIRNYVTKQSAGHDGDSRTYLSAWWALGAILAVVSEVLTSARYWKAASSLPVRDLYQSLWYWDYLSPKLDTSDRYWPSFRIYERDRLIPWAIVLLLGLALSYAWNRQQKRQVL